MERWEGEVFARVKGLWQIEDPSSVDVWHRELRVEVSLDGVPIFGIVDRVDKKAAGVPVVVDYKTGKPGLKGSKYGDQLRAYCLAVAHKTGFLPARAVAYHTTHGVAQEVDVSRNALNKTVLTLGSAWAGMARSHAAATWEAKPSKLCGWCPLALVCPAAAGAGLGKARSAIAEIGPELGLGLPGAALVHVGAPARSLTTEPQQDGQKEAAMTTTAVTTELRFGPDVKPSEQVADGSGQLNPNSYSATALFGTVEMAVEAIESTGQKLSPATVDALAQTFARLVADAQTALGARVSYQDGLNTRLRGALRATLGHLPVPFGQDVAAWEAWYAAVLRRIVSIARAVLRLWSSELPEKPWAPLATAVPATSVPAAAPTLALVK
jgi:putative RecB family exonuclease